MNITEKPHRRYNPLTAEWVLVSPQRTKRPWQGQIEDIVDNKREEYDPSCYLCPGNSRAGGKTNPDYKGVYIFDNDFPALFKSGEANELVQENTWKAYQNESGICKVICFSERHDLSLDSMPKEDVVKVIDAWVNEYESLIADEEINYVQIFENKGAMMGCSNPHPHGQIWASSSLPNEIIKEDRAQAEYYSKNNTPLLCQVLEDELKEGERIVCENSDWLAIVPFWAVWPFEVLLLPKRHMGSLSQSTKEERESLAQIWQTVLVKYNKLFNTEMPLSCGIHQLPKNPKVKDSWQLHAHFYPPLLRSATIKKFMVGYEMLGTPQRDITAEVAAKRLREIS